MSIISEHAQILLRFMVLIEDAVKAGDPIAKPYLEAEAVRLENGVVAFHKDWFPEVLAKHLEDFTTEEVIRGA